MVQQYKPAFPAEFRQQMVELVAVGRSPTQLSRASRHSYGKLTLELNRVAKQRRFE